MLLECLPDVINAAVYGGDAKWLTRDPKDDERAPFRILIAGGGTGDPLLACAHAFYLADIPVEVVHLDLSHASIKIAQRRAEALLPPALARRLIYVRGGIAEAAAVATANVRSGTAPTTTSTSNASTTLSSSRIVDTSRPSDRDAVDRIFGAGGFDFIHSTGVLMHNKDPGWLLKVMDRLLNPDGGMALWVYARSGGRSGVLAFKRMLQLLAPRTPDEERDERLVWGGARHTHGIGDTNDARLRLRQRHRRRLDMAWELLAQLPETNPLRRNPVIWASVEGWVRQHDEESDVVPDANAPPRWDVRASDMFINPGDDGEFDVHGIEAWLASAGLRSAQWLDTETGHYDLKGIRPEWTAALSATDRLALGELWVGTAVGHRVVAVRQDNTVTSRAPQPTAAVRNLWL